MEDIDKVFDDFKITQEARDIEQYINDTWGRHFYTELERPMKELFSEPENVGLKRYWNCPGSAADICVYRQDTKRLVAIVEPGGGQHLTDEKQKANDRRKYMICKLNGVACVQMINGVMKRLSKRQWRRLLGSFLFRKRG